MNRARAGKEQGRSRAEQSKAEQGGKRAGAGKDFKNPPKLNYWS